MKRYLPWLILAVALALRLKGILWGFPDVYEGDSQHLVNTAVYFGSGDLNPHVFKYPTLWMYVLFLAYGGFFAVGRLAGYFHSVADFGALFIWKPWAFFLIARAVNVFLTLGAGAMIMRIGREGFSRWVGLVAGFVVVFSPYILRYSLMGKAEILYLFLTSLAWWAALRIVLYGRPLDYLATGALLGFSAASHYGAIVLWPILWISHGLRARRDRIDWKNAVTSRWLWLGTLLLPLAFFLGSPYVFLDFHTFRLDFAESINFYALGHGVAENTHSPLSIFPTFLQLGGWPVVVLLILGSFSAAGAGTLGWFLLGPVLFYSVFMGSLCAMSAGTLRFMYGMVPGLALLAGLGAEKIRQSRFGILGCSVLIAVLAFSDVSNAIHDTEIRGEFSSIKDTRALAREWIEKTIPPHEVFLLDLPHVSPNLVIERAQVEMLYRRTLQSGNRRAEYYRLMLASHPGGGYRIYRIQRQPEELGTLPRQTAVSQAGYAMLDVEPGLSVLQKNGVHYVVTSSLGARPKEMPRLGRFFSDLEKHAKLLKVFPPPSNLEGGPTLRVYQLGR